MNTKHTPGPWCVNDNLYITDEGGITVAAAMVNPNHNGKVQRDIADANARLVASAPDLLDACIEAEDTFQAFADAVGFAEMGPECHAALEALRAVLQKVRNG